MNWEGAVRAAGDGVELSLEVTPASTGASFPAGFNPWRGRIGARVRAPAEAGRANEELLDLVAAFFEVARRGVELRSGAGARLKRVLVRGVGRERALARLSPHLDADPPGRRPP